jgi:mevalonate kinase
MGTERHTYPLPASMIQASAPGKAILFGEHAVVYDQPAIAVPLSSLKTVAQIRVSDGDQPSIRVIAPDIRQSFWLHERDDGDPLAYVIRLTLKEIKAEIREPLEIRINSEIPIASGLGSGAAASIAIVRALTAHFSVILDDHIISEIAYKVEKLHHGTPSGIDNNVITYEQPLYYVRGEDPHPFKLGKPLNLVLGHCGVTSQTGKVVGAVRERWLTQTQEYHEIFSQIGSLVDLAHRALIAGQLETIGSLMNENHSFLQQMGVSIDALDLMVDRSRSAGAYGAKLSGAGAGGFMVALVDLRTEDSVAQALQDAGGHHILTIKVGG